MLRGVALADSARLTSRGAAPIPPGWVESEAAAEASRLSSSTGAKISPSMQRIPGTNTTAGMLAMRALFWGSVAAWSGFAVVGAGICWYLDVWTVSRCVRECYAGLLTLSTSLQPQDFGDAMRERIPRVKDAIGGTVAPTVSRQVSLLRGHAPSHHCTTPARPPSWTASCILILVTEEVRRVLRVMTKKSEQMSLQQARCRRMSRPHAEHLSLIGWPAGDGRLSFMLAIHEHALPRHIL